MSSELPVVNSFVQGYPCLLNTGIWYRFTQCLRPLNRGARLIKVTFVWLIWDSIQDFGNCPLNTGCPLTEGPLNRGLTVFFHPAMLLYSSLLNNTLFITSSCNTVQRIFNILVFTVFSICKKKLCISNSSTYAVPNKLDQAS